MAQPRSSAIANFETPAAGTAEAALIEGQQAYHQGQLPLALERLSQAIAQFEAEGNGDGVAAAQVAIAPVHKRTKAVIGRHLLTTSNLEQFPKR